MSTNLPSIAAGKESLKDPPGLTQVEAAKRLAVDGPNMLADVTDNSLHEILIKFWAPVPWLLEAAIILQLFLRDYLQAAIVFATTRV